MLLWRLLTTAAVFGVWGCCAPSSSISPPPGWRQVENRRFDLWVPSEIKAWRPIDTNAWYDVFQGQTMELQFVVCPVLDGDVCFTNAPHYHRSVERIAGKKVEITSYYYWASRPYHELISARIAGMDGGSSQLVITATCESTNDYATAKQIFRTLKFK